CTGIEDENGERQSRAALRGQDHCRAFQGLSENHRVRKGRTASRGLPVRQILIDFWMGHENSDMSSRYGKQLTEDTEFRQLWAAKVGLGFEFPKSSKTESNANCATCATNPAEHVCNVAADRKSTR